MQAFAEAEVDVGIYSFWPGTSIWALIENNAFLKRTIATDVDGDPLFQGVEYINWMAEKLAQPEHGVHAVINEKNGVMYFDTQPSLTDEMHRSMKIIERDEMLIDNDDVYTVYWNTGIHFARGNLRLAAELELVRAIVQSTHGYLGLDDFEEVPIPKYLSQVEMGRALEIFNRLEYEADE